MTLKPRLELGIQQRLALTPVVRTRLMVLRLSPLELAEEAAREAARNPFLLFEAPQRQPTNTLTPDITLVAAAIGFQEDLRQQIARKPLASDLAAVVDFLIGELREDGFLDTDLPTLSDELTVPLDLLSQALTVLQTCDPPGIGARDLPECLMLQLRDKGLGADDAAATVAQLPAFARKDWTALSAALGLDQAALRHRADQLRTLTPRPVPEPPSVTEGVLMPDLRLDRLRDGQLSVAPEHSARPRLRLDQAMVQRAKSDGFAPELLARAMALIEAVDQRGRTLARIGDWLIEKQQLFFLHGPEGLSPASRNDLAADLGLHPSTISRAVAGKSIDVDGKLWPLSIFFSSAIVGPSGPVSSRAVQYRISDLIGQESKEKPLSDETLVTKLRSEGIDIARRTVAKYRQGLRIPSSPERRKLANASRAEKPGDDP